MLIATDAVTERFLLQVYVDALNDEDVAFILESLHNDVPSNLIEKMVRFNAILAKESGVKWGTKGAPWEMNLRDLMRWSHVMKRYCRDGMYEPGRFVGLVYANRMRTTEDTQKVRTLVTGMDW